MKNEKGDIPEAIFNIIIKNIYYNNYITIIF